MRRKTSALDILVAAVFCIALCGPVALAAAMHAGIDLPHRLAGGDAEYLEGTQAAADIRVSPAAFASKELQDGIDSGLKASTPFRADALLASSAAQRSLIRLANVPFDWAAYPTYFGSERVYIPSANALSNLPWEEIPAMLTGIDWFCRHLADFAARYPDKGFYLVVPCGGGYPPTSPVYGLMQNPLTAQEAMERLRSGLEGCENVTIISDDDLYASPDEYYQAYYRTDHHWSIRGIETIYRRLAEAMGKEPQPFGEVTDVPGLVYNGSNARKGLMLLGESVPVAADAFANVEFTYLDGTTQPASVHPEVSPDDPRFAYDFYDKYYRRPVVAHSDAEGSAALVRDSFGGAFVAPLGTLYGEVTQYNALPPEAEQTTLEAIVAESGADDVVFVCGLQNIARARSNHPGLFE